MMQLKARKQTFQPTKNNQKVTKHEKLFWKPPQEITQHLMALTVLKKSIHTYTQYSDNNNIDPKAVPSDVWPFKLLQEEE